MTLQLFRIFNCDFIHDQCSYLGISNALTETHRLQVLCCFQMRLLRRQVQPITYLDISCAHWLSALTVAACYQICNSTPSKGACQESPVPLFHVQASCSTLLG